MDFAREFRGEHLDALLNFGIEIDAFDGTFYDAAGIHFG